MNIMNIILEAVNVPKYFPLKFLFSFAIYLKLIRLAMDAIRVPRPPILVPTIKARQLSVKPDKRSAAGTLLII